MVVKVVTIGCVAARPSAGSPAFEEPAPCFRRPPSSDRGSGMAMEEASWTSHLRSWLRRRLWRSS